MEFYDVLQYLKILLEAGDIFLTPTEYKGIAAIRISITNWRTTERDLEIAWQALQQEVAGVCEL